MSDENQTTKGYKKGLLRDVDRVTNLRFPTVLDVRRARHDERVAWRVSELTFGHSFGRRTSTKRRMVRTKRKTGNIFKEQPPSTAFLSSLAQQPFSTNHPQQPSSAAILKAEFLSSHPSLSHHLALISGWWSTLAMILLWSGAGGHPLVNYSTCQLLGQIFEFI